MTLLNEHVYATPFGSTTQEKRRRYKANIVFRRKDDPWNLSRYNHSARNRALSYADLQLGELVSSQSSAREELRRILHAILKDDSAYPTLSATEDAGVMAQWRAGRSYLAIEISSGMSSYTYADLNGVLVRNFVTSGHLDSLIIRADLQQFSQELDQINPNWRDYFVKR